MNAIGRQAGRTRRAMTLMEVVAAVVLIGVAAPPLLMAVRDATVMRASNQKEIVARWLVSEKLEDIIADRHSSTRGWAYVTGSNYPAETTLTGFAGFSRSVTVAETGVDLVSAGTGYKTVTVTVSWSDPRYGNKSLAIATVVTDYTP